MHADSSGSSGMIQQAVVRSTATTMAADHNGAPAVVIPRPAHQHYYSSTTVVASYSILYLL